MSDKGRGLYGKFFVHRVDGRDAPGGDKHPTDYFVLDIVHDPFARIALAAYAAACKNEYPVLEKDLAAKLAPYLDDPKDPEPDPMMALNFRIPREKTDESWVPSHVWAAWVKLDTVCITSDCWLSHPPDTGWLIVQGTNPPKIVWWERE